MGELGYRHTLMRSTTMASLLVLLSVFFFLPFASSSKTPVATCCPPGSFLAIEDLQGSRQLPNGLWVKSEEVLLQVRGDHPTDPQLVLPRGSIVPHLSNSTILKPTGTACHLEVTLFCGYIAN